MPKPELNEYPNEFLKCRVDGHAWNLGVIFVVNSRVAERTKQCESCEVIRTEEISRATGDLLHPAKYKTPRGFRVKGIGTNKRSPFRKEMVRRVAIEQNMIIVR